MLRIYVSCLASYNAGILHGDWIDLDGKNRDEIQEEIDLILGMSPEEDAEEWAIHDLEGFGDYSVGECEDLETLVALSEGVAEHGEAFLAWYDFSGTLDTGSFEDAYQGE